MKGLYPGKATTDKVLKNSSGKAVEQREPYVSLQIWTSADDSIMDEVKRKRALAKSVIQKLKMFLSAHNFFVWCQSANISNQCTNSITLWT